MAEQRVIEKKTRLTPEENEEVRRRILDWARDTGSDPTFQAYTKAKLLDTAA